MMIVFDTSTLIAHRRLINHGVVEAIAIPVATCVGRNGRYYHEEIAKQIQELYDQHLRPTRLPDRGLCCEIPLSSTDSIPGVNRV